MHCSSVSEGSSFPPGNSHFSGILMLAERWQMSTLLPSVIIAQVTRIINAKVSVISYLNFRFFENPDRNVPAANKPIRCRTNDRQNNDD